MIDLAEKTSPAYADFRDRLLSMVGIPPAG